MSEMIVRYDDSRCVQCGRSFETSKVATDEFMSTLSMEPKRGKCGFDRVDNRIINYPQHHCSCVKNQFPKLLK